MAANTTAIKLFAGIGNPGAKYARTRHNAGFWFADELAAQLCLTFASRRKFRADLASGGGVIVAKPETFVNESGAAVAAIAKFGGIKPEEILVIHDEIDLAPGIARIKFGGGEAGHNGLKNISARLATKNYWRLRLGVGRPASGDATPPADYVLRIPPPAERARIDAAVKRALQYADLLLSGQLEAAMLRLHTKPPLADKEAR